MRILLLEDDVETANFIVRGFKEDGHIVDVAERGEDALMMVAAGDYQVLVFDRMVAGIDGLKVLAMLRAGGVTTPALFLTAMDSINDRVNGLVHADDYLVKPFAFAELRARIGALSRRPPSSEVTSKLFAGDLEIDLLRRKVFRANKEIVVQPTEFRLLEHLLRNKGSVVTRTMLLEHVWDFHFDPKTNVVETHISRLRAKIDRGFDKTIIQTIRGSGYRIDDSV